MDFPSRSFHISPSCLPLSYRVSPPLSLSLSCPSFSSTCLSPSSVSLHCHSSSIPPLLCVRICLSQASPSISAVTPYPSVSIRFHQPNSSSWPLASPHHLSVNYLYASIQLSCRQMNSIRRLSDSVLPVMKPIYTNDPAHPGERRIPGLSWLPNRVRNMFIVMLGEFVGTYLFLFFALAATQVANSFPTVAGAGPNIAALLYISLAFGFSLAVNVWVFFRISGGLFNPAVSPRV
jgi:hypothetical protein